MIKSHYNGMVIGLEVCQEALRFFSIARVEPHVKAWASIRSALVVREIHQSQEALAHFHICQAAPKQVGKGESSI